jgi:hypothetical protein
VIHRIGHIEHDYLIADFRSNSLDELNNELIELLSLLLEEVKRCIPHDTVKVFLPDDPVDQFNCFLEFREVTPNCLKEIDIVSLDIDSRNELDASIGLFDSFSISSIIVILILENRLTVLPDFEGVPARTHIVYLINIFQCILKPFLVPRSQKD